MVDQVELNPGAADISYDDVDSAFVLERLEEAAGNDGELDWQTELWGGVTVAELFDALVEANGESE